MIEASLQPPLNSETNRKLQKITKYPAFNWMCFVSKISQSIKYNNLLFNFENFKMLLKC